jgi:hypothetical protein
VTPLALMLTAVVVLSAALILIPAIQSVGFDRLARGYFIAYALAVCATLATAVSYFVGFDAQSNPRLPLAGQRRFAHLGYYADPGGQFVFVGKAGGREFEHEALGEDERVTLTPLWNDRAANEWRINYKASTRPLRVGGHCINVPEQWWLSPGDVLTVFDGAGGEARFFSVRWDASANWYGVENTYSYSQGVRRGGQLAYDVNPRGREVRDLPFSAQVLREGRRMSFMLAHPLTSFEEEQPKGGAWAEVFEGITWVREQQGDSRSRMGVLVSKSLFEERGIEVYKNGVRLDQPAGEGEQTFASDKTVFYGLGFDNTLNVRLQNHPEFDPARVEVFFVAPQTWPLPPPAQGAAGPGGGDIIITSGKEYIPIDSYYVNLGGPGQAFYAKARLSDALDSVTVNDGKAESVHGLNEVFRLGDLKRGALLALTPTEPSIKYAGWWVIGFLLLAALAFSMDALRGRAARWRLDLAWTLVWGLTLTILTVRFILAYRLSLLPPADATPNELANVFHRGLGVSFKALLIFPSGLIAMRFLARSDAFKDLLDRLSTLLSRLRAWLAVRLGSLLARAGVGPSGWLMRAAVPWSRRHGLFVLCALAPLLWIVLSRAFGQAEALFGGSLRLNLLTHVILVALIALTAERLADSSGVAYKLGAAVSVLLTLGLMIFWIGDRGFLIYGIAFGLYIAALLLWEKRRTYFRFIIPVLVVVILSVPPLLGYIWSQNLQGTYLGDTTNFRIASYTQTENAVLLARSDDADTNIDRFLSNIQQHWQMLLYAARGAREPSGFGRAPLTHKAMTYATSMADCVYSVYLLSEHGTAAGCLLVLVYIMLCLALMYGSWYLPSSSEHRALPLLAVGAFFVCNALYMASANISLLPFTGQNIPLLSLYSTTDLVQNWLLLALCVWLLTNGVSVSTSTILKGRPAVRELGKAFLALVLLWGAVFTYSLRAMAESPRYDKYTKGFDLRSDVLDEIKLNVDPQRNNKWALVGETMTPQPFAYVSEIEQRYAQQFNEREGIKKYSRDDGLYYIQRLSNSQRALRVNDRYFRMESPFAPRRELWRGLILSRDDQTESLVGVLGRPLQVTLSDEGQTQALSINKQGATPDTRSTLLEGCGRDLVQVELKRQGGRLLIGHKKGDWVVYVNGNTIQEDRELNPHDIVVVERGSACRYSMMYLGPQPAPLAYVKWQNGEDQRIVLEPTVASLVYAIGSAADRTVQNGQAVTDRLTLTLDMPLQHDLQQAVADYAGGDPHYRANDPFMTDSLAVSVLDAYSGEALALPSWPLVDPGAPKYAKANVTPARAANLITNRNLVNHAIGSTIKPLMFSTMASQLWPEDLAQLSVHNRPDRPGPGHVHTRVGGIPVDDWDCGSAQSPISAKQFIYNSLNFYEATIGTIGLLFDKADLFGRALEKRSGEGDVVYKGQEYSLDLKRAPVALSSAQTGSRPSTDMDKTLLFQGLPQLFDVQVTNRAVPVSNETCRHFIPSLCGSVEALQSNEYADNAMPQPVVFAPNSFQYFDINTLRFFIGADQCLWNNVTMAEAAARLVTGRRIAARLERGAGDLAAADELPAPLNDARWRYENLIDPLERTGQVGTARFIGITAPPNFKILYKTGTIDEGNKGRESENLLFVVGQWDAALNRFVPGKTLACFLYMKESKRDSRNDDMKKFAFARPIIKRLLEYLQEPTQAAAH